MSSQTTKRIIVEKRGAFDDDSFFKDSWSEWDQAMKDAVDRWDKHTGQTTRRTTTTTLIPAKETKTVYRKMRTSNVTSDESQAVSCTEEDGKYKMVMDVKDFSPEDISVKVVDDVIVVEGKIEKKEGNSVTTQKFVRRFLLPPGVNMNAIGSALSKDGVLTINAPKLAYSPSLKSEKTIPVLRGENTITSRVMGNNYGRPKFIQVTGGAPAGKPTHSDKGPFNPTGGSNVTVYELSNPRAGIARVTETITVNVPDRRNRHMISTKTDNSDHWTTFNTMVQNSQREMEDMMKDHTLTSTTTTPASSSSLISAPLGVATTKDVIKTGNTVTERQEKKWDDSPAPGIVRTNRALQELSEIKDDGGHVIGNKSKMEKESKAEGSREETLPDGTKRKIFTKTYETKNSYISNIR